MRALGLVARRQHDDRHRGRGADEAGEIEAGLAGHHDVEDQQVEMQAVELGAGVAGARRRRDAIAFAAEEARQQIADAAVVVDQQQMRRVVGRFSAGFAERWQPAITPVLCGCWCRAKIVSSTLSGSSRSIIARRNARTVSAPSGAMLAERAVDPVGLQAGELCHQRLALRRRVEQALAAVVVAGLLHDIAFVEQLLEHPSERLLGDAQHVEQVGDLQAGIAVDEMQHPVMRPAEAERLQLMVGVADEIPVGEEQQLDDIPAQIAGHRGAGPPLGRPRIGRRARHLRNLCQPY